MQLRVVDDVSQHGVREHEAERLPEADTRYYIHPSEETPADKIDFTDPAKLQETWALVEADAKRILRG